MKKLVITTILINLFAICALAQTTEFTYQGRLLDSSLPPTANYDFQFSLWDSLANGTQQGATQTITGVAVTNGIFTVRLNFGNEFPGAARFLQIEVRPAGGGAYTTLAPRQTLSSAPYAIRSLNATNADTATNSLQLGGVAASQYVVTTDPRMTDERNPLAGSGNYIQNQNAAPQAASNFNISGTGTADILNAATQYNIGTNRVLSVAGTNNIFAGVGTGAANTTGANNAFFGQDTGQSNTTGSSNAFFGKSAGFSNTTGSFNAFFGSGAGGSNTTGGANAFFGRDAGFSNTQGNNNAFFGGSAGSSNTTGNNNAFFGPGTGFSNTQGNNNAFFGRDAGVFNTTGNFNAFFGGDAGRLNTTGSDNAFFGESAGLSNTTGGANAFFGTLVGRTNTTGGNNAFFGTNAGRFNTTGGNNAFFGTEAGSANTTGTQNAFFGAGAGVSNTTGIKNTSIGDFANVGSGALTFATAIGANAVVIASNQVQLGRVGLDTVRVGTFNAGGPAQVCVVSFVLTACSSSLRYKENVQTLGSGLNLIERLRPVTFDWKDRKEPDLGLIAEEVAEVEPLLVIRNDKGVIEGVKYNQISAVLINAVKEQQAEISGQRSVVSGQQRQIDDLNSKIEQQQEQIDALKKLVCAQNPTAELCKEDK